VNLERSKVTRIAFDSERADVAAVVAFARRRKIWLHIDVDVLEPAAMPAVVFAAPGGVPLSALADLIAQLAAVADVRGFEVCGYDPTQDERHRLAPRVADLFTAFASRPVAA